MLWQCDKEMMLDVWRLRFGTSRVGLGELHNWDWLYVAQLLHYAGMLKRIELHGLNQQVYVSDIFYQLEE